LLKRKAKSLNFHPNSERAKNGGVLGEEIFCPRALPACGGQRIFCPARRFCGGRGISSFQVSLFAFVNQIW